MPRKAIAKQEPTIRFTKFGRQLPDRRASGDSRLGAAPSLVPFADVEALTDDERAAVLEFFAANPDGGYRAALKSVQISATSAQAKMLLHSDPEIVEARFKPMGLDEGSLFMNLGQIASNLDHKDCLRANTFGLNAIWKWAETRSTEHTGADGGPMEVHNSDVAAAVERFTSAVVRLAERGRAELAAGEPSP